MSYGILDRHPAPWKVVDHGGIVAIVDAKDQAVLRVRGDYVESASPEVQTFILAAPVLAELVAQMIFRVDFLEGGGSQLFSVAPDARAVSHRLLTELGITLSERPVTVAERFGFGEAIHLLKAGKRVCRAGWNGKRMWLTLIHGEEWASACGDSSSAIGAEHLPFIAMKTADGKLVPWLASQTDMLGEDWEVVHVS